MSLDALFEALSGYTETNSQGDVYHFNSAGELHRLDGPAILRANGIRYWYKNNVRHRIDGPAIEFPDGEGDACWYINGMRLYDEDQFNEYVKKMKLGQQK